jgi:hypothetical protein
MRKKSPLKPTRTRSAGTRARKLTPKEALKLGRTTRMERKAWRRRQQIRRAAQRARDRKKAALLAKHRQMAPGWTLPPPLPPARTPAGMDYGSRIGFKPGEGIATDEEPEPKPRSKPAPSHHRAVRAEPTRGTHGPNRAGESARSWRSSGERNPTRVPVDVTDFIKEEF